MASNPLKTAVIIGNKDKFLSYHGIFGKQAVNIDLYEVVYVPSFKSSSRLLSIRS